MSFDISLPFCFMFNMNYVKHLKHTASADPKRLKVKCLTWFCQREADGNRIRDDFQSLEHLAQALGIHNRWNASIFWLYIPYLLKIWHLW